ncbi:hypothetical protein BDC45DRAFT_206894 [Circinella umbellata]|nr:hypothetical protein BDC45DRAFT_206894 [Circinella umbellata]
MEDSISDYLQSLEKSNTPNLKDFIDKQYDEIIDFFTCRNSTSVTIYYDVKSLTVSSFKETMESKSITDYNMNKKDIDWESLTADINRFREIRVETERIEYLRNDINERTSQRRHSSSPVLLNIDTLALKAAIIDWHTSNPESFEVLEFGILDFVTNPNPGTLAVLENNTDTILSIIPAMHINQAGATAAKKTAYEVMKKLVRES